MKVSDCVCEPHKEILIRFLRRIGDCKHACINIKTVCSCKCCMKIIFIIDLVCPWPEALVKCTGYSIYDLQGTCLKLYTYCLTDTHSITDNRAMKLQSVVQR